MLNIDFSRALAGSDFHRRGVASPEGKIIFQLADKSGHVRLSRAEWDAAGKSFRDNVSVSSKKAKYCLLLHLPAFFLAMAICNLPPFEFIFHAMPRSFAASIGLALLVLPPIGIYLWHSRNVQRVSAELEELLGELPRVEALSNPVSVPRWLDIAGFLLVGPGLLFAIIGELRPGIFRNTPFADAHLGPLSLAALAIIAARLLWPRLAIRDHR